MSNQETDTKPEPGSYAEFHATILHQIRRWETTYRRDMPPSIRLALAQDIAANLWQGFIQEQQALIRGLVEALGAMRSSISLDLYRKAAADHGRMQPAEEAWALADEALALAKAAGYVEKVTS